mmetsp:Transcript_49701/g.152886  ORF Transcript_49701/g.152886 Transcript_49701/m.152886 type:complete len:204 (+) Transcript_49701:527-1138(+)
MRCRSVCDAASAPPREPSRLASCSESQQAESCRSTCLQWKRWRKRSWYLMRAWRESTSEAGQPTRYSKVKASRPGVLSAAAGGGGGDQGDGEAAGLIRDDRYQSGFLGVYKHGKTFVAKVMRDGALRSLGAFQSAESAAAAYAAAVGEAPATSLAAQMAEQQQQQVAEEQVAEQQVAAAATAIAPDPAPLDGVGPAAVPPCGA